MNKTFFLIGGICALFVIGCKEQVDEPTGDQTAVITDSTALEQIIESESTEADVQDVNGRHEVHNERYGFTFVIPSHYKAVDKSNNGDGYFIDTGDKGVDIRIFGENISENTVMAELALKTCERTEPFRFDNGYPGVKCYQSGDLYYYYDTPDTRVTLYIHAGEPWMERNASVADAIAKSIRNVGAPFN